MLIRQIKQEKHDFALITTLARHRQAAMLPPVQILIQYYFQQTTNCTCDVDGPEENSLSSNFAISFISSLYQQGKYLTLLWHGDTWCHFKFINNVFEPSVNDHLKFQDQEADYGRWLLPRTQTILRQNVPYQPIW